MLKFRFKPIITILILILAIGSSTLSFASIEYQDDLCTNSSRITASSTYAGRTPDRTIDDNFTGSRDITSWHSGKLSSTSPIWIMYDFGDNSPVIQKYTITPGYYPSHSPSEFTFQGSNDLENWSVLDAHSGYDFEGFGITESFTFQNKDAFRYYRIHVTGVNSHTQILLNEIEMMEAAPAPEAPNAPSGLNATIKGDDIHLTWNNLDTAEHYTVYRSTTSGGAITVLGSNITTNSFTDTTVEKGTKYYYYITAHGEGLESPASSTVSEIIPEPVLDNTVLTLILEDSLIKSYEMNANELDDFLDWYSDAMKGNDLPYFKFDKTNIVGPFKSGSEFIIFDKIVYFDITQY
ncbi:discoidin domain-containing protein [Fusibacter sp. JL216-2]|uniref:discoidin domain-containing protein n=1 Tax=Fusibacter sp. JL216-2 TaxID=3071453 RepID=UPI003D3562BD